MNTLTVSAEKKVFLHLCYIYIISTRLLTISFIVYATRPSHYPTFYYEAAQCQIMSIS